jgi:hypothetical protein
MSARGPNSRNGTLRSRAPAPAVLSTRALPVDSHPRHELPMELASARKPDDEFRPSRLRFAASGAAVPSEPQRPDSELNCIGFVCSLGARFLTISVRFHTPSLGPVSRWACGPSFRRRLNRERRHAGPDASPLVSVWGCAAVTSRQHNPNRLTCRSLEFPVSGSWQRTRTGPFSNVIESAVPGASGGCTP